MNRRQLIACALGASLAGLPAFAGELAVTNAWSRSTPPGVTVGVAYFTLKNDTGKSDRLLKITTPVASKVQVHRTEIQDGMARMREVAVLHVDAGQTLEFAPSGMHLMLMGLKQPLVEGRTFEIDLLFEENGSWVVVDYKTDRWDRSVDRDALARERYTTQLADYAAALRALGEDVRVGTAWVLSARDGQAIPIPIPIG